MFPKKIIFIFFILLIFADPSIGAVAYPAPTDVVKKLIGAIKLVKEDDKLISKEDIAQNERHKAEANSLVDISWLSEWSLGKFWGQRTTKEQKEFRGLMEKIFKNVAYPKTGKFFRDLNMTVDREKIKKEKAVISTTIIHAKEGEIEIDYKLRSVGGRWLVYDVVMDGVSLGRNLKTKFLKIIRDDSYAELVRKLRDKLNEKEAPEKFF